MKDKIKKIKNFSMNFIEMVAINSIVLPVVFMSMIRQRRHVDERKNEVMF
jgi:hypothetical protein